MHCLDFDLGYSHLFVNEPKVDLLDDQGHRLRGSFDASVEIVSASLTFRWGGPHEITPVAGKEVAGYRK
jgi:long-subunit fatty acid transport protein